MPEVAKRRGRPPKSTPYDNRTPDAPTATVPVKAEPATPDKLHITTTRFKEIMDAVGKFQRETHKVNMRWPSYPEIVSLVAKRFFGRPLIGTELEDHFEEHRKWQRACNKRDGSPEIPLPDMLKHSFEMLNIVVDPPREE